MSSPETEQKILDLLADGGEHYGLELVERSDGALWRGTVYVHLDRLEQQGLVSSRAERTDLAPGRLACRLYRKAIYVSPFTCVVHTVDEGRCMICKAVVT